jgi:anthraniloyl-CoA monooxygenase
MRIAVIGGGPAGLYFAISMKLRSPAHQVELFERNREGVTFGWGVVFSDQTVETLAANDPVSARAIADEFAHWDDIEVHFRGEAVRTTGHGFIGIGRQRLLEVLTARARELGVMLHFEQELNGLPQRFDLVVAADGINSRVRDAQPEAFGVEVDVRANKFVWLGTQRRFDAFTSRSRKRRPAGSGPTPIASTRNARPLSSNVRRRPGAGSASTGWSRRRPSPPASGSSPGTSRARRC